MSTPSVFSTVQPLYAAQRIATFPVRVTADGAKKPSILNWQRVGLGASAQLAEKFPHAEMLGFCAGPTSGITVIDVDSTDEAVLAEALARHGETPVTVRTANGKYHLYYRHNGEARLIRPWPGKPIDLLGNGLVVAQPSVAPNRQRYTFVRGGFQDLRSLPIALNVGLPPQRNANSVQPVREGHRNRELFMFGLGAARDSGTFEQVLEAMRRENAGYDPPLDDNEVQKTADSVWSYQIDGKNWIGEGGVVPLRCEQIDQMASDPDAFHLFATLMRYHNDKSEFIVANAMAQMFGWSVNRFRSARRRLEELGQIRCLHPGGRGKGDPPIYCWTK